MKICTKCKETKVLDDFPKDKGKKDGRRGMCKQCKHEQDTARENEDKIYCARGKGGLINKGACMPGCNDVCKTCEDRQEGNLKAINNTTAEEDKAQIYNGGSGKGRGGGFTTKNNGSYCRGD